METRTISPLVKSLDSGERSTLKSEKTVDHIISSRKEDADIGRNSSTVWKNFGKLFYKTKSKQKSISTINFAKDKDFSLHRLSSLFRNKRLSQNTLIPVTNVGESVTGYQAAFTEKQNELNNGKVTAMTIRLPHGITADDVAVTVELSVVKSNISESSVSQDPMAMSCVEDNDVQTVFTGVLKIPNETEMMNLLTMPLYLVDSSENVVLDPGSEISHKTIVRTSTEILRGNPFTEAETDDVQVKLTLNKMSERSNNQEISLPQPSVIKEDVLPQEYSEIPREKDESIEQIIMVNSYNVSELSSILKGRNFGSEQVVTAAFSYNEQKAPFQEGTFVEDSQEKVANAIKDESKAKTEDLLKHHRKMCCENTKDSFDAMACIKNASHKGKNSSSTYQCYTCCGPKGKFEGKEIGETVHSAEKQCYSVATEESNPFANETIFQNASTQYSNTYFTSTKEVEVQFPSGKIHSRSIPPTHSESLTTTTTSIEVHDVARAENPIIQPISNSSPSETETPWPESSTTTATAVSVTLMSFASEANIERPSKFTSFAPSIDTVAPSMDKVVYESTLSKDVDIYEVETPLNESKFVAVHSEAEVDVVEKEIALQENKRYYEDNDEYYEEHREDIQNFFNDHNLSLRHFNIMKSKKNHDLYLSGDQINSLCLDSSHQYINIYDSEHIIAVHDASEHEISTKLPTSKNFEIMANFFYDNTLSIIPKSGFPSEANTNVRDQEQNDVKPSERTHSLITVSSGTSHKKDVGKDCKNLEASENTSASSQLVSVVENSTIEALNSLLLPNSYEQNQIISEIIEEAKEPVNSEHDFIVKDENTPCEETLPKLVTGPILCPLYKEPEKSTSQDGVTLVPKSKKSDSRTNVKVNKYSINSANQQKNEKHAVPIDSQVNDLKDCLVKMNEILITATSMSLLRNSNSNFDKIRDSDVRTHSEMKLDLLQERQKTYEAVENDIKRVIDELLKESKDIKESAILKGAAEESEPPFTVKYVKREPIDYTKLCLVMMDEIEKHKQKCNINVENSEEEHKQEAVHVVNSMVTNAVVDNKEIVILTKSSSSDKLATLTLPNSFEEKQNTINAQMTYLCKSEIVSRKNPPLVCRNLSNESLDRKNPLHFNNETINTISNNFISAHFKSEHSFAEDHILQTATAALSSDDSNGQIQNTTDSLITDVEPSECDGKISPPKGVPKIKKNFQLSNLTDFDKENLNTPSTSIQHETHGSTDQEELLIEVDLTVRRETSSASEEILLHPKLQTSTSSTCSEDEIFTSSTIGENVYAKQAPNPDSLILPSPAANPLEAKLGIYDLPINFPAKTSADDDIPNLNTLMSNNHSEDADDEGGTSDDVRVNINLPKHRYKSKLELNSPQEVAEIEKNLKDNAILIEKADVLRTLPLLFDQTSKVEVSTASSVIMVASVGTVMETNPQETMFTVLNRTDVA